MPRAAYLVVAAVVAVVLWPWSLFVGVPMLAARWFWTGFQQGRRA